MNSQHHLWFRALLILIMPLHTSAQEQLHIMGFVERPCANRAHCFILKVEPEYRQVAGAQLVVQFDNSTIFYDPENYQLTLAQQRIVSGAHLRLQLSPEEHRAKRDYRAITIWIGD